MKKSVFNIPKMDCSAEENLIRMKLDEFSDIEYLNFDLAERKLTIYHHDDVKHIESAIYELKLGANLISSSESNLTNFEKSSNQRKLLWSVLAINFAFFMIEMTTGLLSESMGLVADSLDMLADSFVYGISLFAVGATVIKKKKIARIAGYFQIVLAIIGFVEVLRRFLGVEQLPDYSIMITVSVFALIANAVSLFILQKSKGKEEAHIKASMIFTSNDIIINCGVIAAGFLVNWLNSNTPDLVIGTIVFAVVIQGAYRILQVGRM